MKKDILSRACIILLVNRFYSNVRANEAISYIFEVAKVDWEKHLPKMYDFWESILLGTVVSNGNPMKTHIQLSNQSLLLPIHFETWLDIWHKTINENFEGQIAEAAKQKAIAIASVMKVKIQQSKDGITIKKL